MCCGPEHAGADPGGPGAKLKVDRPVISTRLTEAWVDGRRLAGGMKTGETITNRIRKQAFELYFDLGWDTTSIRKKLMFFVSPHSVKMMIREFSADDDQGVHVLLGG